MDGAAASQLPEREFQSWQRVCNTEGTTQDNRQKDKLADKRRGKIFSHDTEKRQAFGMALLTVYKV